MIDCDERIFKFDRYRFEIYLGQELSTAPQIQYYIKQRYHDNSLMLSGYSWILIFMTNYNGVSNSMEDLYNTVLNYHYI